MSFGYSRDFHEYEYAPSPPPTPAPMPSGAPNRRSATSRRSAPSDYLLWPLVLLLVLAGIAFIVRVSLQSSDAGVGVVPGVANVPAQVSTPTLVPSPTVIAVDTPSPPLGYSQNMANVAQPATIYVPYPVIIEREVMVPQPAVTYNNSMNAHYVDSGYQAGSYCGGQTAYVVRPGDTVFGLSRRFGVGPEAIISMNGLWDPNYIRVGQVLQIPCAGMY